LFSDKSRITKLSNPWEMFNDWEVRAQRAWQETDLTSLCRWYGAAWEMAREHNSAWTRQEVDSEKIQRLNKIRGALSLLGEFHERSRT